MERAFDWKVALAHEVWRDVGRLPGLPWQGSGTPEVLVVGDDGLEGRLWPKAHVVKAGGSVHELKRFEDVYFDRVVVCGVLEHAPDSEAILRHVARVLRPDGLVLLMVANRRSPWVWWQHSPWGEGRPYSREQLRVLVQEAGLKWVACRFGVRMLPSRWAWMWRMVGIWRSVLNLLAPWLGGVVLMVATKDVAGMRGLKQEAVTGQVKPVPVGVSLRVRRAEK